MLKSFGPLEIMLILGAVVLIFGSGKIAQLGKGMGQAISNFRRESKRAHEAEYCPDCHAELEDNAKFCPECGTVITSRIKLPQGNKET
jgi:TatA/E family protein of Tat protein translocase